MIASLVSRFQQLPAERRQFLFHAALAALFRVFSAGAAFLLSVVAARTLGTHQSGLFFLALSLATLLGTLSLLGMDNALLRFIGKSSTEDATETNQVFTNAYAVVVPTSTVVGLIVFVLSPWLSTSVFDKPGAVDAMRAFAVAIPLISLFFLNGYALQATRRVIASVCSMQLGVTVLLLPALYGLSLYAIEPSASVAATLYTGAAAIVVLSGLVLWFRQPAHRIDSSDLGKPALWKAAPNLWLIAATGQAIPWASVVIVGFYTQSQDVAYFSAAQRTSLLITFMLMVVNFVAAPRFSALFHAGEMDKLKRLAQFSTRLMIAFSLPVLLAVLVWPEQIMRLFGEDFVLGAPLLVILAIGQTINVMTGSVGFLLTMCGHERDMRNVTVFAGLLTLTLTFILTHIWGTLGAAIAVSVGLSTQNLLAFHKVKSRLGFWPIG
ncbi:oligosaccharide flippase family protein [Enterovibrio norvegicus]|uniref:Oligosaccharide flippase family protein n=1 Tax=Enterovibrio norvegicus TaxID=188144 RepID=A0ABV4L937_9GAMM|nr:oligosaccharide flippase family protein [Enterovibrio norvegicus]OEE51824.1 capsular biosynthesis protein CpsJ [Enterovibrio norvegicus]OEF57727.1 capsular biosynthesis protein CpsJ [Enterovibrio norvegicus]